MCPANLLICRHSAKAHETHFSIISIEKGTCLTVRTPVRGRYARPWSQLANSLYLKEWYQEISLNKTSKAWILLAAHHQQSNELIRDQNEFQYIKGYWEWTEDVLSLCRHKLDAAQIYDFVYASLFTYGRNFEVMKVFFEAWCPLNNTLLTSLGELSISLWDLHSLAGLPLTGSLYDEVIPSFEELTGVDQTNNRFVPHSCKYLFHDYHLL
ncbi:hypothetical protein CDL12_05730 [Handroanthus impetiginosus]|uniref:Aminotransferase-like plant mobile domain-containing protein n=1 Tax=Handroanthus impetiginosus TaxID=429701 RepID=A0A2G9HVM0_9LAMI|nr:hypothetical protein CDL12_05730 [Handroanthus impetiginosus]